MGFHSRAASSVLRNKLSLPNMLENSGMGFLVVDICYYTTKISNFLLFANLNNYHFII